MLIYARENVTVTKGGNMTDEEIRKAIGEPALWEGIAEEAVEFAHAALKVARIMRGENPTPAGLPETLRQAAEEYTDLRIYAGILRIQVDAGVFSDKKERLVTRLKEAKA